MYVNPNSPTEMHYIVSSDEGPAGKERVFQSANPDAYTVATDVYRRLRDSGARVSLYAIFPEGGVVLWSNCQASEFGA